MTRRTYRNPPAIEAVCEFRFRQAEPWDTTIPFRLYDLLRESYSETPKQELTFAPPTSGPEQPGDIVQGEVVPRVELRSSDGSRLLRVAPGTLSVSVMAPYPGWEDFRAQVIAALDAYRTTGGSQSVLRMGVRYINRIRLPQPSVELSDYFTVPPPSPSGLPENLGAFLSRQEFFYDDLPIVLILTVASAPPSEAPQPHAEVILDLDVIQNWPEGESLDLADALPILEALRTREREAFEACLTDATRKLFDNA